MKYIKLGMVLCVMLAMLPKMVQAQINTQTAKKSTIQHNDEVLVKNTIEDEDNSMVNSESSDNHSNSNSLLLSDDEDSKTKSDTAVSELNDVVLSPAGKVNIAYRQEDQSDLIGGVSYINMPELLDKNYITYSLENMEAFIGGYTGNIWGMTEAPLIMVDGVPMDAGSVMPTEIDQISFLKGISAVTLYGSRAAKGVILISTKRGVPGKQIINVRANAGVHLPKRYPKYLGSAEYMTLFNEAMVNDGLQPNPDFSEEAIYHHASGENPYRYPNVDYYSSDYLRDYYNRYDATLEIAGGNDKAQYYTNLGFWTAGSLLDFGQADGIGNERFNVRGNVDMKINDFISAKVDASAILYNGKGVNTDYWRGAATLRPHRFSPFIPVSMIEENDVASMTYVNNSEHLIDGKYLLGGTQLEQTNPIADVYAGGSNTFKGRQFLFNTGVDADLSNVVEGLSFSSMFGLNYNTSYIESFNNEYAVYEPSWTNYSGEDLISELDKIRNDASSRSLAVDTSYYYQTISASAQLNYQTDINNKHNISAMLVAGGFQQTISTEYHRVANANLGLHFGYNFKEKYYVDLNGALIHSARLPEANRQAISPTFSLGWRLSNESFLANSSVVNNLMLSVSGGILHTDMDIPGYFLYEQIYSQSDGTWYSWRDGLLSRSTDSRRGSNPELDFAKREEISIGVDAALFDNLITLNTSAFVSRMTGIVVQNGVLFPSYFSTGWPQSSFIPYVNYNNDERRGVDFNINLNKSTGSIDWTLGISGTYFTTEATQRAEILEDEYQLREGRPLDAIWGLENLGFFEDQDDIDNSPNQDAFGGVRPGDIKYKDQNNDGIINTQDEVYLGKFGWYGSPLTLGTHLTAKWNGFTFFALGVFRYGAYGLKNSDQFMNYYTVDGTDKYSVVVRDRWTEETKNTATYPRLSSLANDNNYRNSDFWLYSTDRFDLAKVQVTYTFPESMFKGFIDGLGVYINGSNLLTVAPNREILELNVQSAPQTRFFNLGITAQF